MSENIALPLLDQLIETLRLTAEVMWDVNDTPAKRVRDPKDDYLVALAMKAHVDYLVTGDKDLFELDDSFSFKVIRPAEFLTLLHTEPGQPDR